MQVKKADLEAAINEISENPRIETDKNLWQDFDRNSSFEFVMKAQT